MILIIHSARGCRKFQRRGGRQCDNRADMADDLWAKIARMEEKALSIARIRFACAKAFSISAPDVGPRHLAIWITTETDEQRDALASDGALRGELVAALRAVDYPEEAIPHVVFTFESHETVVREWGGDWWSCIK
jgi:hypothetical protein